MITYELIDAPEPADNDDGSVNLGPMLKITRKHFDAEGNEMDESVEFVPAQPEQAAYQNYLASLEE